MRTTKGDEEEEQEQGDGDGELLKRESLDELQQAAPSSQQPPALIGSESRLRLHVCHGWGPAGVHGGPYEELTGK